MLRTRLFITNTEFTISAGIVFPHFSIIGLNLYPTFDIVHPFQLTRINVSSSSSKSAELVFSDDKGSEVRAIQFNDGLYVFLQGMSGSYGFYCGCMYVTPAFNSWVDTLPVTSIEVSPDSVILHPTNCYPCAGSIVDDIRLKYNGYSIDSIIVEPFDSNKQTQVSRYDGYSPRLQRLNIMEEKSGKCVTLQGHNINIMMTKNEHNNTAVKVTDGLIQFTDDTDG